MTDTKEIRLKRPYVVSRVWPLMGSWWNRALGHCLMEVEYQGLNDMVRSPVWLCTPINSTIWRLTYIIVPSGCSSRSSGRRGVSGPRGSTPPRRRPSPTARRSSSSSSRSSGRTSRLRSPTPSLSSTRPRPTPRTSDQL